MFEYPIKIMKKYPLISTLIGCGIVLIYFMFINNACGTNMSCILPAVFIPFIILGLYCCFSSIALWLNQMNFINNIFQNIF